MESCGRCNIVSIIKERITDPQLSVEELSKDMAMSRSSLHKKLKSLSGYMPNELIKLVKLKQAAGLLQQNQHAIADIAYMTASAHLPVSQNVFSSSLR